MEDVSVELFCAHRNCLYFVIEMEKIKTHINEYEKETFDIVLEESLKEISLTYSEILFYYINTINNLIEMCFELKKYVNIKVKFNDENICNYCKIVREKDSLNFFDDCNEIENAEKNEEKNYIFFKYLIELNTFHRENIIILEDIFNTIEKNSVFCASCVNTNDSFLIMTKCCNSIFILRRRLDEIKYMHEKKIISNIIKILDNFYDDSEDENLYQENIDHLF